MNLFQLKLNLQDGVSVVEEGFDRGVSPDGSSRLELHARFEKGDTAYYLAGRMYSFPHAEELQDWLRRFSPERAAHWAKEADGDFMVVVFDRLGHVVHLISDRNGANRVYYAQQGQFVSFSNSLFDIVGLTNSPGISGLGAYSLLTTYYVLDPYTLVEPVRCTMPGQLIAFGRDGMQVSTYYSPVQLDAQYFKTQKECVQALDDSFRRVFRKRVSAARTPCVLLSGGVDSMAMLKYLSEAAPGGVHSLTFSVRGQAKDEHEPARLAARHFRSEHHELIVEPAEAASLYLQCFQERLTPNISNVLALAVRNYLQAKGGAYDVYSGEDTRLHTPDFDLAKEMGIHLNLGRNSSKFSTALRRLMVSMLNAWPVYPKDYLKYWTKVLQPYKSRDQFVLECLCKVGGPSNYQLDASALHDGFLKELPQITPGESMQSIFKKHVAMAFRLQYTDNMADSITTVDTPSTALQLPFYDWETVEVSNRIPYHIGKRGIFTLRSWSKFLVVNKQVLREVLKGSVPESLLYRRKATAGAIDVLLNVRLQRLIGLILRNWLNDLLGALPGDVANLVQRYVEDFCRARSIRAAGQRVVYAILSICEMAVLNKVCAESAFPLDEQMECLYEMSGTLQTSSGGGFRPAPCSGGSDSLLSFRRLG